MINPTLRIGGADVYQGYLAKEQQQEIVHALRDVVKSAPLFSPEIQQGKKMSVRMTSAGKVGWNSDANGYRYQERHPDGQAWPGIPEKLLQIWGALGAVGKEPDSCLINYYGRNARMGMHQDKDEASFDWPVVSISLGDDALFRMGGTERNEETQSIWLQSGDIVVLSGKSRLAYHGIDKTRFQSSTLLRDGGRINVTLRVAG